MSCKWCYAKNAQQGEVNYTKLNSLLDFLKEIGIRTVILLGGEPTCSVHLEEIVFACNNRGFYTVVITNGIKLADIGYLNALVDCGVKSFSISQKAWDQGSYLNTTGVDCYGKYLEALNNLVTIGANFIVSYVLTADSIPNVAESIKIAKGYGATRFSLGFCYDFESCHSPESGRKRYENPFMLWNLFEDNYEAIHTSSDGQFVLQMGLPLCVANDGLLSIMDSRKQISTVCQLLKRSGLLFDTDFSVIPCNAMYDYKLGKYGVDFCDKLSFEKFLESRRVMEFYDKLCSVPDIHCLTCKTLANCGGGCVSNWFNYSFSELQTLKEAL